ncbi:MAG: ATP-binding protein [Myxococcales bacterium]|nr:ATP-binding protein [Myxococcales bacterium]
MISKVANLQPCLLPWHLYHVPVFSSHIPVTERDFWNRSHELGKLGQAVDRLEQGHPHWIALIGSRKIGKTSLLRELERRRAVHHKTIFAVADTFEVAPDITSIFKVVALRILDRVISSDLGVSLESLSASPDELRRTLQHSDRIASLPAGVRTAVYSLADGMDETPALRACVDLPEQLAQAWDQYVIVAIDEFQELTSKPQSKGGDVIPMLRALWQRHRRVGYVISGSERTMLLDLVTSKRSPFFGHFDIMDLGPFDREDAIGFLCAPHHDPPLSRDFAKKVHEVLGGHPFYLQLFGQSWSRPGKDGDADLLKDVLGELVFSNTGRLSLHFLNEHGRLVGRSGTLAAVLDALATRPQRLFELAATIRASSAATKTYVQRLGDAIIKRADLYALTDPVFASWLRWRGPGGAAVPMKVIGDEAEANVAAHLARLGFDLIYQSRASRGAFDLLAIRGGVQLGVQVKRTTLPLSLPSADWKRMEAEAARLGWRWVVAVATPDEQVRFLDPSQRRGGRIHEAAAIANLLLWLDRFSPQGPL